MQRNQLILTKADEKFAAQLKKGYEKIRSSYYIHRVLFDGFDSLAKAGNVYAMDRLGSEFLESEHHSSDNRAGIITLYINLAVLTSGKNAAKHLLIEEQQCQQLRVRAINAITSFIQDPKCRLFADEKETHQEYAKAAKLLIDKLTDIDVIEKLGGLVNALNDFSAYIYANLSEFSESAQKGYILGSVTAYNDYLSSFLGDTKFVTKIKKDAPKFMAQEKQPASSPGISYTPASPSKLLTTYGTFSLPSDESNNSENEKKQDMTSSASSFSQKLLEVFIMA